MIRIELGAEVSPGIWEYVVPSLHLCGKSRQPLLDACRQLERILGDTAEAAGLFREGRTIPDISCSISEGAGLTVAEPKNGKIIHFAKYRPFDRSAFKEAAE
jgi:hypothetical protein